MGTGKTQSIQWIVRDTADAVADTVTTLISKAATDAIDQNGAFSLVLAGGSTPRKVYSQLAASDQAWGDWALYYGDERCLPVADSERNSHMVEQTGLAGKVARHYPIPAELGAEAGAADYEVVVAAAVPFDLVLLGMGEDGHTASLFPGYGVEGDKLVIPVHGAPKPPPDRISLTPRALTACRQMLVMVTGRSKAAALQAWLRGEMPPVARVAGAAGDVKVITDLADILRADAFQAP